MRSVRLSRALAQGKVKIRTGRNVTGQLVLKFRTPNTPDRLLTPYPLQDQHNPDSFINLSKIYSADQIAASNLEDLINSGDVELGA